MPPSTLFTTCFRAKSSRRFLEIESTHQERLGYRSDFLFARLLQHHLRRYWVHYLVELVVQRITLRWDFTQRRFLYFGERLVNFLPFRSQRARECQVAARKQGAVLCKTMNGSLRNPENDQEEELSALRFRCRFAFSRGGCALFHRVIHYWRQNRKPRDDVQVRRGALRNGTVKNNEITNQNNQQISICDRMVCKQKNTGSDFSQPIIRWHICWPIDKWIFASLSELIREICFNFPLKLLSIKSRLSVIEQQIGNFLWFNNAVD